MTRLQKIECNEFRMNEESKILYFLKEWVNKKRPGMCKSLSESASIIKIKLIFIAET